MRTESLLVKLSVTLLDGKDTNAIYSIYETDIYDYITVNLMAYVVIQYKPKFDVIGWDVSRSIRVNEMSIFTLIRGLKDFYSIYQKEDLFTYYKSGSIECNATENDTVSIALFNNQFIELKPSTIIDPVTNEVLPGIIMNINNSDNKVQLSSDEFEAFMYRMSQINIQSEAMNLVMMSMLMEKDGKPMVSMNDPKSENNRVKDYVNTNKINIFQRKEINMNNESVTDKRILVNTPKTLDEL